MTFEIRFTPPWKVTAWGFLLRKNEKLAGQGCDEWHNPSIYLIIPLIGMVTIWRIKYHQSTPQHVHGMSGKVVHGDVVAGCSICVDILNDMLSDVGGKVFRDDLVNDMADPEFLAEWNRTHTGYRCTGCGKHETDHPFAPCDGAEFKPVNT